MLSFFHIRHQIHSILDGTTDLARCELLWKMTCEIVRELWQHIESVQEVVTLFISTLQLWRLAVFVSELAHKNVFLRNFNAAQHIKLYSKCLLTADISILHVTHIQSRPVQLILL